jgi:Ca2+-binding RTX toxin-like protein
VVVDIARDETVGEPGEGDVTSGFERVTGGTGDDRLAGDGEDNFIDGRGGSNLLVGRGGDDFLQNASGHTVRCGSGVDRVTHTRARTRVPSTCDRLSIRLPRDASVDTAAAVDPSLVRKGGVLGLDLSCPEIDGYNAGCRTTVRIVTQPDHQLLATGRLGNRGSTEHTDRFVPLRLTTLGHRLHGDRRRQLATTMIRGPLMARTAWTIGF